MPEAEQPNIDRLREALHQRAAEWKAQLREEPKVARLLLRPAGGAADVVGCGGARGRVDRMGNDDFPGVIGRFHLYM